LLQLLQQAAEKVADILQLQVSIVQVLQVVLAVAVAVTLQQVLVQRETHLAHLHHRVLMAATA
jgi:hypothetical protein